MDSFALRKADSEENDAKRGDLTSNLFLTNLLSTLPKLDSLQTKRYLKQIDFVFALMITTH